MDDLISRVAAVRIIADMHGLCRNDVLRESIQAIKEMPTIDAIPVEWLREKMNLADDAGDLDSMDLISWLIQTWQKEQEAQDDRG